MNQKIDQEHLIKKKIIGKGGYGMTRLVQDKKVEENLLKKNQSIMTMKI